METVSRIAEIYASAVGVAAVMWLLIAWYPGKPWVRNWHIVLWFLVNFALAHFMILPNTLQSVIGMVMMILTSWILLEGRKWEKALVVIAANIFQILVSMTETEIAFLLSGERLEALNMQGNILPVRIVGIVLDNSLYLLTSYLLTRKVREQLKLKREERLIIAILYGLFFCMAFLSITVFGDKTISKSWQMILLILDLMMLAANVVVLRLIVHMNRQNYIELENAMLKLQIARQEEHIRQEEKNEREIRTLRHDMKRYFVTYQQLLREGNVELVEKDMERVLGEKLEVKRYYYSKSQILNAVLNEKAERCQKEKIHLGICVAQHLGMENMDIGIMLSNLLDNAIEAELREKEEQRKILLDLRQEYEMLHLVIKNYISESVLSSNPGLITGKKDKERHGIGLKGIKEFVKQKEGEIEIFEHENMFVVHICMCV